MTREEIINGLKMSIDLMLFDPTTGEVKEPHQLNDMDRTSYEAFKGAMEILAQPQRMRGRWSGPFCSKCGISKYNFVKILHTDDGPCGKWNYCPNCGARMDGGEQDDPTRD